MRYFFTIAIVILGTFILPNHGDARESLILYSKQTSEGNEVGFASLIATFKAKYPAVDIEDLNFLEKDYKSGFGGFLTAENPDILFWFPSGRLKFYVDKGLIEDISDMWKKNNWDEAFHSSMADVTFDNKQYALPIEYYQWGFYYRKDILAKFALSPPQSWQDLVSMCKVLRKNNIVPFVLGAGQEPWPAAGWFDYLFLRMYGIDNYKKLAAGKMRWTDDMVSKVFDKWGELVKNDCYSHGFDKFFWRQAVDQLWSGQAAMMLIGNFVSGLIPPKLVQQDLIDYAQFPVINPKIPMYENAPADVIIISKNATHKDLARKFLEVVADAETLKKYNTSTLSPNRHSGTDSSNKFMAAGERVLSTSPGTIAYFDNEFPPDMANIAMNGFVEFLLNPSKQKSVQARLEAVRKRLYKTAK